MEILDQTQKRRQRGVQAANIECMFEYKKPPEALRSSGGTFMRLASYGG